jgi:hypothetical protein
MGKDNDQSRVYLVDFGISKFVKDANGKHMYDKWLFKFSKTLSG